MRSRRWAFCIRGRWCRHTARSGRNEQNRSEKLHPIVGDGRAAGWSPTIRGERTFPPASRRGGLNVTEDNEIPIDLSELDSGTRSDPVFPSLTSCRHLGAETEGPASKAICTAGCRSCKYNDFTLTGRRPEGVSEFTAACAVPIRLEKPSRYADIGSRARLWVDIPGEGGGSCARARTSASASDTHDPGEFSNKPFSCRPTQRTAAIDCSLISAHKITGSSQSNGFI